MLDRWKWISFPTIGGKEMNSIASRRKTLAAGLLAVAEMKIEPPRSRLLLLVQWTRKRFMDSFTAKPNREPRFSPMIIGPTTAY